MSIHDGKPEPCWPTGLSEARNCADHLVAADSRLDVDLDVRLTIREVGVHGSLVPAARLRRIGWLDQRGQVWTAIPPAAQAEAARSGSFTPLLIDPGERDGS